MNNNQKIYFDIDSNASTDQVFTLLDDVQSDNEDEIDKWINDFDSKLIAREEIKLTDNQENVSALTLEAKVRRKYPDHMEAQSFSHFEVNEPWEHFKH